MHDEIYELIFHHVPLDYERGENVKDDDA